MPVCVTSPFASFEAFLMVNGVFTLPRYIAPTPASFKEVRVSAPEASLVQSFRSLNARSA